MFMPTVIMAVLAVVVTYLAYQKGAHVKGMQNALMMTIQILPLLIFAFVLAGMMQEIIPKEHLSRWIGEESGIRGILIGSVAGAFSPGGPYVSFPIAAGLLRSGASIPTMVAFVVGWSLWGVARIPLEIGILGWRFAMIRLFSVLIFPPLAGFIAQGLLKIIR